MYDFIKEFSSDLSRRLNLFVSLLKNKDTISAILWLTVVSNFFYSQYVIGYYILLLFPAALTLYLLIAYQLLLSFVNFKLNAFNAQRQLEDTISGKIANYIFKFVGSNGLEMDNFIISMIKDVVKAIWAVLGTALKKIRSNKILRIFKLLSFRKQNVFYKKMISIMSKSHAHFWQFVKKFVELCTPKRSKGRGFTNAYWNLLIVLIISYTAYPTDTA
jgi:hypothetical protein